MGWKRGQFKGRSVWVEVGSDGEPVVEGGRTPIRYDDTAGAKVYRAGVSRIALDDSAEIRELDDGVSADSARPTRRKGSGFGKAGTRTARQAAMAAEAARALIGGLGPEVVKVYTDGSCRGNPGPAGAGAVVELPDGRRGLGSVALGRATNNVGELTAIGLALDLLEEADVDSQQEIALFTDSSYSNGVLTLGWKAKANRDLILALRERLKRWSSLEIHWIAGHVGTEGNEQADRLANEGVEGRTATRWIDPR